MFQLKTNKRKHFFHNIFMLELKDTLTIRRKNHGNKSQVAKKLGISSQLLGQYEQGRQKPKLEFYKKWKEVFGEDLLKETNVSNLSENNTPVEKSGNNKLSTPDANEILRQIVDGKGQYILINKELILEKYRLRSVEDIEEEKKEADRRAQAEKEAGDRKVEEEKRRHEVTLAQLKERQDHIDRLYSTIDALMRKIPDSAGQVPELKST